MADINAYELSPSAVREPKITRERLVELMLLAQETVAWLESKGLKTGEQCAFRHFAETLWFSPKGQ